ncbi:hypothetical protein A3G67_03575 [Candidatus Roizmanbacteria bacterium RIFCSPLOWO2_12_FULL_40_12]|uniref:Type II secretion system protein GspG C-terminal domain-containing protein n=1 Tax=Candidatus Roizmanbacteria bacterium RIFCSPLOWO2_01_FULL_40_42 TaxID=1802066 RepID=A0A1F7J5L7_9BACT|nr:MAG: hypothetical protein A2779_03210 [Candidatus Roizmanbacteria bacterium RIFCSPHIGHO2_01_FULL_40_98]OGK28348.1 MAG: hypothetical protein A3C31_00575 [Candidatus Roizmanbacteria bacterium RIFCSPHIGHO2_02_FULL_40_53]OGK30584.1 MAG: hypothetical protein A2W49_03260 [Candidatus Roizmanbacteria bacterium RIFCSPHIGHO2_12_41_18]OGK36998.1 MAG: hypothetical protein A3E69_00835 [Candidatus Roizmanbacteria bacterium RIFCSPHIGHO2_12_FULL_40_130]OGK50904.1 MAG: hypothetical protein A3B50_01345 [Candi
MKKFVLGFTLVEILVVTTIIGMLAAVGSVSYTAFTKNARDARRKADLEEVRGAMELYRSNNSTGYPSEGGGAADQIQFDCNATTGKLEDSNSNKYLSKIPEDPKCPTSTYDIISISASDYVLGARLEGGGTDCGGSCGGGNQCNYCLGPYGQQ